MQGMSARSVVVTKKVPLAFMAVASSCRHAFSWRTGPVNLGAVGFKARGKAKLNASTLLTERSLWRVVEASLAGTDSAGLTRDRQTDLLIAELGKLSKDELIGYAYHSSRLFREAYKPELWAVAYIVMGGCGDDCFMDFRWWLVTRGETVYRSALNDHDSLCEEFDKIPAGDIPLWEDAMSFAQQVFDERFGEGSYDRVEQTYEFDRPQTLEPLERTWSSEDEDSLKTLCPATYARWSGNLRF